ncbi:MAG TPA: hypothetical protein VEA36_00065 [Candidatus Paceibacterota bacterium]|nr:hypothetical protein [Candidatus Paceibacterota bacterium]
MLIPFEARDEKGRSAYHEFDLPAEPKLNQPLGINGQHGVPPGAAVRAIMAETPRRIIFEVVSGSLDRMVAEFGWELAR